MSPLPDLTQWLCSVQVRGCSDTVRQPDAGCCRPQRKSPGMEGSRGVERALADNGQPASVGRPELKNKTTSCLSLVAKHATFFSSCCFTSSVNKKWSFSQGFSTYAFCHRLQWFSDATRFPSSASFSQEMHRKKHLMSKQKSFQCTVSILFFSCRPFPGSSGVAAWFVGFRDALSYHICVYSCSLQYSGLNSGAEMKFGHWEEGCASL